MRLFTNQSDSDDKDLYAACACHHSRSGEEESVVPPVTKGFPALTTHGPISNS